MSETPERITLYYREAKSNKVYQAAIEPQGDSFADIFAYGRRVSTLKTGTKTPAPVDYATAKKIYDQLVKEKMAKSYTSGKDGTPYQGTTREFRATGILPQLLNPIDEAEAQLLIADPDSLSTAALGVDDTEGQRSKGIGPTARWLRFFAVLPSSGDCAFLILCCK
jgi:predicted DNA-binding WGR domain protein